MTTITTTVITHNHIIKTILSLIIWFTLVFGQINQNLDKILKHLDSLEYLLKNSYSFPRPHREGFDSLDYFAKNGGSKPLHIIKTLPLRSVIQIINLFDNVVVF